MATTDISQVPAVIAIKNISESNLRGIQMYKSSITAYLQPGDTLLFYVPNSEQLVFFLAKEDDDITVDILTDEQIQVYDLVADTTISALTFDGSELSATTEYPSEIGAELSTYTTDAKITLTEELPTGATATGITYNGTPVTASELDLGGKTSVYLSELIDASVPTRNPLGGHAGLTIVFAGTLNAPGYEGEATVRTVVSDDDFTTEIELASKKVNLSIAAE